MRKRLPILILTLAALLPVGAQDLPGQFELPEEPEQWNREKVDALWLKHLRFRLQTMEAKDLIVESYCREALAIAPTDVDLVAKLAEYYVEKGEATPSAMAVLYLRLLDEDHPLVRMKWEPIMTAIRLFDAGPATLQEIEFGTDFAEGLRRAAVAREKGLYIRAENYYRLMLTHHPANRILLEALGSTYILSDSWGMAAMLYRYALHLYPDHVDFANNYALALDRVGRGFTAIEVLRYHRDKNPESIVLNRNLGQLLWRMGDVPAAAQAFAAWTAAAPLDARAWEYYGESLLKNGKSVFAKVALRKAVDLDPSGTSALKTLLRLAILESKNQDVRRWKKALEHRMSAAEWAELLKQAPYNTLPQPLKRRGE